MGGNKMNETKSVKALKKQLAAAIAMVCVDAIALGSSTYAWFAQNTNVTAEGMSVQAQAEDGILISNSDRKNWSSTATATSASAKLFPTSTRDVTTWYHNKSQQADDAEASQKADTYEKLSLENSKGTYGVGYVDTNNDDEYNEGEASYYLLNEFTIKSSAGDLSKTPLYINSVTVKDNNSNNKLDAALRIAIKVAGDENTYIYAPVTEATATYKVGGADKSDLTVKTNDKNIQTTVNAIPSSDTGVKVQVYAYFEGEDANCKSTNISGITPDELSVSVVFGTATIS